MMTNGKIGGSLGDNGLKRGSPHTL